MSAPKEPTRAEVSTGGMAALGEGSSVVRITVEHGGTLHLNLFDHEFVEDGPVRVTVEVDR